MVLNDEQALELGRELMRAAVPDDRFHHPAVLMSFGRIAVKLSEPYVLEGLRNPSLFVRQAGQRPEFVLPTTGYHAASVWDAMIDARLSELSRKMGEEGGSG